MDALEKVEDTPAMPSYWEQALLAIRQEFPQATMDCFSDRYDVGFWGDEKTFLDRASTWEYPGEWFPGPLGVTADEFVNLLVEDGLACLRGQREKFDERNHNSGRSVLREQPEGESAAGEGLMEEMREHRAYELLEGPYSRVACDYVILPSAGAYAGLETHKAAVIRALEIIAARYELDILVDAGKMTATKCSVEELLEVPSDDYFAERKKAARSYDIPEPLPYWYAFLEPPLGTPYGKQDFLDFNKALIPSSGDVEVYRWNDDFSNYFDAGKEWWGTGLWSICNAKTGECIVVGASLTD